MLKLGWAARAGFFKENDKKILIGKDTRILLYVSNQRLRLALLPAGG